MFTETIIALGSNLGNRNALINNAVDRVHAHPMVEVVKVSSFIETTAVSHVAQPDFINGAILAKTILDAHELLTVLKEIELQLGRQTKGDYGPRPIDLDIILFGTDVVSTDDLVIPHPLCHQRDFVLQPAAEIAADFSHPVFGKTLSELLIDLTHGNIPSTV